MKKNPMRGDGRGAHVAQLQDDLRQLEGAIGVLKEADPKDNPNAELLVESLERDYAAKDAEMRRELGVMIGGGELGTVLAKGQSMRDAVDNGGPDVTLGQIVRGRGFGQWDTMSPDVRALVQSTDAGGAVPGAITAGIVDLARETSCVFQAGAGLMPVASPNAKVARLVSAPTAEWAPESPSRDLSVGALVFDTAEAASNTVWLYTEVTVESSEDCLNLDETIANHFSRQLALIFDESGLAGTGADMPIGLTAMGTSEDRIIEMNALGELVDHRPFVRAMGAVRAKHYQPTSVILTPGLWTELNCLQDTTHQPLRAPAAYSKLNEFTSSFLPSNGGYSQDEHTAIVGDLHAMVFTVRTGATIEISRLGDGFKKGAIAVRAYLRMGMFLTDPEAVAVLRGLTLPVVEESGY